MQVRGYKIRLPLDVMLVASANPEDYTNRGRIITPLKDRFGAQIRTHYPLDVETEVGDRAAGGAAARRRRRCGCTCPSTWPRSWRRCRTSPVRARTSTSARACRCGSRVSNYETLVGQRDAPRAAPRRDATSCPASATSRRSPSSTAGKVEIESARGGPRRADRRAPREGGGAHRVQGALQHRAAARGHRRVRRGHDRARRRRRAVGRRRRAARATCPRFASRSSSLTGGDERPRPSRARSSSSSRACTSRSGSTRTPSGARATYRGRG